MERQMLHIERASKIEDDTFSMFWSRPKSGYAAFADRKALAPPSLLSKHHQPTSSANPPNLDFKVSANDTLNNF